MNQPLNTLPLQELRALWAAAWGKPPHGTMGRTMMVESLKYKRWETDTGGLPPKQKLQLECLIRTYKRNPSGFDKAGALKPGTRLVRAWKGKKYTVTVTRTGFDYEGAAYTSLSQVANIITGSRWNGWLFFGLKGGTSE